MSVNDLQDREERPPYVRFETRSVQNKKESIRLGRFIADDVDYVLITPPNSRDLVHHKVDYWFSLCQQNIQNKRIQPAWVDNWRKMYEMWKQGQEIPENGTSVKNWPAITPAQCKNMISAGVRTIEDMAACNDESLKRLGMGATELRNKARAYLKSAVDHGPVVEQNAKLIKDNERLQGQVDLLVEKLRLLSVQAEGQAVPRETEEFINVSDIMESPTVERFAIDPVYTDEELVNAYTEKFGKKPHHRMKMETIRESLK